MDSGIDKKLFWVVGLAILILIILTAIFILNREAGRETVTGTITTIAAPVRVLTIEVDGDPVNGDGAGTIALAVEDETVLVDEVNTPLAFTAFQVGDQVEARGRLTAVDTMITDRIILLGDGAQQAPINVSNPQPNQLVQSPLVVTGEARGTWYFEASFPVKLLDAQGNVIAQTAAQAQGEWMTTQFVPFMATLQFTIPSGSAAGTLILEKDNPSGLPEQADEVHIPVRFNTASVSSPEEATNHGAFSAMLLGQKVRGLSFPKTGGPDDE